MRSSQLHVLISYRWGWGLRRKVEGKFPGMAIAGRLIRRVNGCQWNEGTDWSGVVVAGGGNFAILRDQSRKTFRRIFGQWGYADFALGSLRLRCFALFCGRRRLRGHRERLPRNVF